MSDNRNDTTEDVESQSPILPKASDLASHLRTQMAEQNWRRAEAKYRHRFSRSAIEGQEEYAHLQGIRDHYKHKRNWSLFLMGAIAGLIIFQSILLGLVGAGNWDFTEYEWLLPALLVQNLGQVIGLAVIVVRSLFKEIN